MLFAFPVHVLLFKNIFLTLPIGTNISDWYAVRYRINKLVFIGKKLDRAELNASFEACLV